MPAQVRGARAARRAPATHRHVEQAHAARRLGSSSNWRSHPPAKESCSRERRSSGARRLVMFTRILVPLDGSLRSERALPVAARVARATGAAVTLARVIGQPTTFGPGPSSLADVEALIARGRETA